MAATVGNNTSGAGISQASGSIEIECSDDAATSTTTLAEQAIAGLSATPTAGQLISHNGQLYTTVKEGLAYILIPSKGNDATDSKEPSTKKAKRAKGEKNEEHQTSQSVFYNEIMQYNRDLSVLAIRAYGEDRVERWRLRAQKKEKAIREGKQRGAARQNTNTNTASDASKPEHDSGAKHAEVDSGINGLKRSRDQVDSTEEVPDAGIKRLKSHVESAEQSQPDATGITTGEAAPVTNGHVDEAHADEKLYQTERSSHARRAPRFKILDALSATGLRALRYASELPFVDAVVANDLSSKATQMIAMNVEHNKLQDKISPVTANANAHMYQFVTQKQTGENGKQYEVIDLDPYGTAVPFLDSALQALTDGGLLCVTCTDTAVFMSNGYTEKAFSLYGGTTVKGQCAHEGGLRLMLHAIATTAAKYGIAIEPLLSLSIDYYARVFVTVRKSPADVKFLMSKTMTLNHCDNGCFAITPQWLGRTTTTSDRKGNILWKHSYSAQEASEHCKHCGFKTHVNGPMWGGPLHNPHFIDRILSYLPSIDKTTYPTHARLEGMLTTAIEELQMFQWNESKAQEQTAAQDAEPSPASALIEACPPEVRDLHPFYVFPASMAKVLRCMAPSEFQIRGALRHAGFKASRTHAARSGIKTDAPPAALWHIMREWVRQKAPVKPGSLTEGMAGWKILYGHNPAKWPKQGETEEGSTSAESSNRNALNDKAGSVDGPENVNGDMSSAPRHDTSDTATFEVIFDEALGRDVGKKLKRFQLNPRANWGPMARAK